MCAMHDTSSAMSSTCVCTSMFKSRVSRDTHTHTHANTTSALLATLLQNTHKHTCPSSSISPTLPASATCITPEAAPEEPAAVDRAGLEGVVLGWLGRPVRGVCVCIRKLMCHHLSAIISLTNKHTFCSLVLLQCSSCSLLSHLSCTSPCISNCCLLQQCTF